MTAKELELKIEEAIQKKQSGINTRQWILKMWLEQNFVPGKWFTIEEICERVIYNGEHLYTLNKNPRIHDKCILLSDDVRAINWNWVRGYKVIIKNEFGSIKLVETRQEFEEWENDERLEIEIKAKYLNLLKSKIDRDGTIPYINQAGNVIPVEKLQPIDVFMNLDDEDMNVKIN